MGGTDLGYGVSVDGEGNVVAAGAFEDTASFGPVTLTAVDSYDMFVAKLGRATGVREDAGRLPSRFALLPNYPNPFNPETRIQYTLPWATPRRTTLRVYNIAGELVRTLVDKLQGAGEYGVVWGGRDDSGRPAASGIYFCRLSSGRQLGVRKLTLLK